MDLQTLIPASDRLTDEMQNIYGGLRNSDPDIICSTGLVQVPTEPGKRSANIEIF
jgi:hypothetical protein